MQAWQVNSSAYRRLEINNPSEQSEREYNRSPDCCVICGKDYLKQIVDESQLKISIYLQRNLQPLERMAHLQHNKVATGLIDFTFNPLVALWFACDKENNEDTNGKVIVLENDRVKINRDDTTHLKP